MADNHDGAIVIDTELDREGFERGAEKMLSALKELSAELKGFGGSVSKSMDTAIATLRAIGQTTDAIYERLGGGATQAAEANNRFASSMNEARDSVSGAAEAAGAYDSALAKAQQKIDAQKAKLSEYYSQLEAIQASTDEILRQTTTDDQAAHVLELEEIELQKLNEKYADKLKVLKDLEAEYQRLAAAQSQARQSGNPAPTYNAEDVKTLAADIAKADKAVDGYQAKVAKMRSVGASDSAWKSTRYDISQATAQLEEYRRNLEALKSSGQISPDDYERLSSALDTAAEKAQKLSASQHVSVFREKLRQLGATALQTAGNLAKISFKAMGGAVRAAANGVKTLASRLKNFIGHAKRAKTQSNALVKTLTSLKRMLITRIKRMFISSIFNSAKESLQTLAKFSDSFNNAMSNIKNSSKELSANLAVSMGRLIEKIEPIITKLIDSLSKAITYINAFFALLSGKQTMTVAKKQTDSYRDSLDGAAKSAEELKNQVYGFDELNKRSDNDKDSGGANDGSDLFEEVPIDSVLPDKLKELFEELKKLWEDTDFFNFGKKLAEGLNALMEAADDWINNKFRPKGVEWAKNIAEILNGLVDGFDWELMGKTLADGLNSVFDIINTFLTTFDFEALGKDIGKAINGWFDNVEWGLLGQTFANGWNALVDFIFGIVSEVDWANVGDSIAEFIQNFFDTIDWDKTAQTIITAINGIVEAFDHLFTGVDWNGIGQNIGKFLSDSLSGVDWDQIGETFANKWNALIDLIFGLVGGIDWATIGDSFAEGFSGFINTVDWETAADTITTSINGIIEAFQHFIDGVDWNDLGSKLGTFINDLFEDVDWAAAGQVLGDAVKGVLNFITTAIEETDWQAIGNDVAEFIGGVDWAGVADALFGGIGAALGALAAFLWGLIEKAWDDVVQWWRDNAYEDGQFTIEGLLKGIGEAIKDIGTWIKEHIFQPFIDSFKKAFGINSPSTVMAEQGGFIVDGLLQGIKNTWNTITQFFTTAVNAIKNALSTAWNAVKQAASTAWEGIKSTITQKFEAAKTAITNTANAIKTGLTTAWNAVKQAASTAWEGIKNGIKEKFDAAKQAITTTAENIKTGLSTAWNTIKQTASTVWEGIKSTVTQKWDALKNGLNTATQNMNTAITNGWNDLKQTASGTWSGITSTVTGLWNGLKDTLSNTDWCNVGSNLVSGLQSGITSAWTWLSSTVSSLASSLTSGLRSLFGIHSPSKAWAEIGEYLDMGLSEGLENEKRGVLSTVSSLAKSVNAELAGDKATLTVGAEMTGVTSELTGVAGVLSDIANTFRSISDVLSRMGGLYVPAIATGTEVPYKARVADSGGDVFDSPTFTGYSNNVEERLSNMDYKMQQLIDRVERMKNIDNDALAAAIAFALNGAQRGFGTA